MDEKMRLLILADYSLFIYIDKRIVQTSNLSSESFHSNIGKSVTQRIECFD